VLHRVLRDAVFGKSAVHARRRLADGLLAWGGLAPGIEDETDRASAMEVLRGAAVERCTQDAGRFAA
jgi:hypothetical protein